MPECSKTYDMDLSCFQLFETLSFEWLDYVIIVKKLPPTPDIPQLCVSVLKS